MTHQQPGMTLLIPKGNTGFYFFIHNKGQMIFPRTDEAFGSFYIYREMQNPESNPNMPGGKILFKQGYRLERTHWKTLNTESQRCDEGSSAANMTNCITQYLEQKIGCSVGLYGSDRSIKR